ncbi:MAG: type II toxin-antitoxin system VapB family antitoxin [Pseudomonadota bacterium]|nr:type II toxin-antitoxin system VapB family antitoxin [Pseudomonadota bacterium]
MLDDRLVKEVMRLSKARTKRAAVDIALRDFVSRGKQRDVLALIGEDVIAADYDVRAIREQMIRDPG